MGQFCDADAPRAQSPWLGGKAAETRHLAPLLAIVWERFTKRTDHDNHVSVVIQSLTEVYSILGVRNDVGHVPLFMSEGASLYFRAMIDVFLVHVSFLREISKAQDPPMLTWNLVSKFHSMWHCGFESQFGHPSSARTYLNEDYMQHVKAVGMANRYAVAASRRSQTIAERIVLGRSLELLLAAGR